MSLPGCGGGSAFERVEVAGTVTYDGKPIENGMIRFTPLTGTSGPPNVARISQGRYEAKHRGGVQVGKHRVQIYAYKSPPETDLDGPPHGAQYLDLPAIYNTESQLEMEIPSGSEKLTKDFELTRK